MIQLPWKKFETNKTLLYYSPDNEYFRHQKALRKIIKLSQPSFAFIYDPNVVALPRPRAPGVPYMIDIDIKDTPY